MNFSDYVVYVDESGDHSLTSIDQNYPIFVLAFCVFRKADYSAVVSPALQDFKFRWFGRDNIILHEREIRQKEAPFSFLQKTERRVRFMDELTAILKAAPMTIIPTAIRKDRLAQQYVAPDNPYHLSLLFCMERLQDFLDEQGQVGQQTHILFEQRGGKDLGGKEDKELELEFFRIKSGDHYLARGRTFPDLQMDIVSKKINSAGLQVADLVARPIGQSQIRPDQPNRAMDVIREKLAPGGTKTFP